MPDMYARLRRDDVLTFKALFPQYWFKTNRPFCYQDHPFFQYKKINNRSPHHIVSFSLKQVQVECPSQSPTAYSLSTCFAVTDLSKTSS